MDRRMDFKYRIIKDETVYLRMADCINALGYSSEQVFIKENPDAYEVSDEYGLLIEESKYNNLLNCRHNTSEVNMQITYVETLECRINNYCKLYPIKYMLAKELLEHQAYQSGYSNIDDFINKNDIPAEIKRISKSFESRSSSLKSYNKKLQELKDPAFINMNSIAENGLELQFLTVCERGSVGLLAFIIGENCIKEVLFDDEYIYTDFGVLSGEVYWKEYCDDTDFDNVKISDVKLGRDFREFNILENLIWTLYKVDFDDEGDWLYCDKPGVSLGINKDIAMNLLSNGNIAKIVLIPGIVDWRRNVILTKAEIGA